MVNFHDCDTNKLIENVAVELKNVEGISAPDWSAFVKTGSHVERSPDNPDWWYVRSAAVLRKVANLGPVGTSKLRVKFGGRKNRGARPERFRRASGKIIRVVLQQLEKAQLVKQVAKGVHKGRIVTPKGMSILDKQAIKLIKETKKEVPKAEPKVEPKAKPKEEKPAEVPKSE